MWNKRHLAFHIAMQRPPQACLRVTAYLAKLKSPKNSDTGATPVTSN